jgi:hypothetical protein
MLQVFMIIMAESDKQSFSGLAVSFVEYFPNSAKEDNFRDSIFC